MKNNLDHHRVCQSFAKAASTYDKAARLQKITGEEMLARLDYIALQPKVILDLGSGTGALSEKLQQKYPTANMIAVDKAVPMLHYSKQHRNKNIIHLAAEGDQLPLQNNSVDMIFSNMVIHWFADLSSAFTELQRVLKPEGVLMFSTLGLDTLNELRCSWQTIDQYSHVNDFLDMHDVGDLLLHAKFADPVMDMEMMPLYYDSVLHLMSELKAIGAHNNTQQRQRTLTAKSTLRTLQKNYEKYHHPDKGYLASYEVIFGHAWGTDASINQVTADGVAVPIHQLRRKS